MSKRLNKRQQREVEELEELKAREKAAGAAQNEEVDDVEEEQEKEEEEGPVNPFAALDSKGDVDEDDDEEEEEAVEVAVPKKSKKKSKKKKKTAVSSALEAEDTDEPSTSASTPSKGGKSKKGATQENQPEEMDEIERALAELDMKAGNSNTSTAGPSRPQPESRQFMAFRNLLSVDPKNLDADAELRRFFGSKVIASTAATSGGTRHRPTASSKLRYTISKPKPTYPPATSLAGLGMRELSDEEIEEAYERRGLVRGDEDKGEKWFTFEHSGPWREIERQFLGAVRSHDPNELMALLQVYPWHVDTLLQMSEVYRLQSDIGAASDYAERALYAFDRCLLPTFNVSSGACRLDFDRVENRPMYTALHRIISYLGRRGCWVTAFNFAKLLFSLDPFGDPHGAAFWLDFLAVKSGNGEWLVSLLEQSATNPAAAAWHAYPGMAYAQALALRADEVAKKHGDHSESDAALRDAIRTFPQVVIPLADKIGASIPPGARSNPLMAIEAGWTESPSNVLHLLAHIYVSRSEALWKDATNISFFERAVTSALPLLNNPESLLYRGDALARIQEPRDPVDESINVPLFICRHVLCSESTSFMGYLPKEISSRPFDAYDPLPPTTAVSVYDNAYFSGLKPQRGGRGGGRAIPEGLLRGLLQHIGDGDQGPAGPIARLLRQFANGGGEIPQEAREELARQLEIMRDQAQNLPDTPGEGGRGMPGAFPGAEHEEAN